MRRSFREVSTKEQGPEGIHRAAIDGQTWSRYSQAQIKDLVAYTNPRFYRTAQSSGSILRRETGNLLKAVAPSVSFRPAAHRALNTKYLYTTLPGGTACGPVRSISPQNLLRDKTDHLEDV